MAANRPYVIIGNWKMHKTISEARSFVDDLISSYIPDQSKMIGLAVPYTLLFPLSNAEDEKPLKIGAQNMNDADEGAFTGEIAGSMLIDAGARFVLIGHSERRHLYGEDDACINRKMKRALQVGLQPILCIGETEEQYDAQDTHAVIEQQLTEALKGIDPDQLEHLIVAYEPVWAIGNGRSASPEIAQNVHLFCRQTLAKLLSEERADKIVIQYGGSVNPSNARELLAQPDIDGLLIGGASLSLDSFRQIVNDSYSKTQSEG